jgi:hypothetical protein
VLCRRAAGSCSRRPWLMCEPGRAPSGCLGRGRGCPASLVALRGHIQPGADAVLINLILLGAVLFQDPLQLLLPAALPRVVPLPGQSSYTLLPLQLPGPRSPRPAGAAGAVAGQRSEPGLAGWRQGGACAQRAAWARAGRLL